MDYRYYYDNATPARSHLTGRSSHQTQIGVAVSLAAAFALAFGAVTVATPAAASSTHDCPVKYQTAKTAGTLNGQKWNDFREAECGSDATAAIVPNTVSPTFTTTAASSPASTPTTPAAAPTRSASTRTAAFPSAVDPK